MSTNPYLAAPGPRSRNARRGALGALNFPMVDPQVMAMLEQMQAGAAQQSAMPQFGAAVAPLGGAVTQPTMMDGAMGPAGPMFQQIAAGESVRGPGMGAPPMAQSPAPSAPVRQPQPGEGAASQRRGPGRIELFDVKPETFAATSPAEIDETPIAPVAKTPEPTLKDRIANFGQRAITPNEKTGISAMDGLIAAAQMIEAGQPTWDLSPQNHGMAGVAAALGGMVEKGRDRVAQTKAEARDDTRFAWESRDQTFRGEDQVRQRGLWADEDGRKKFVAAAVLDPGLPAELRKVLPGMAPEEQNAALLKYYTVGPNGVQRVGEGGEYITENWRGDQTGTGRFTAAGERAQSNFRAELGVRASAARGAGRPDGVSAGYVKPSAKDQAEFTRYATEAENGQEALTTLFRIQDTVRQLGQDEFGQPISATSRMKISQIAGQNARARGLHQQLNADTWNIVLENLKGLAPVSEAEIKLAMERTVSGEWTQEQALRYVDNLIARTERMVERGYTAMDFVNSAGSYASGKDAQGRTWTDISRERYANLERPSDTRTPQGPGAATPPKVGEVVDGMEYIGGNPASPFAWRAARNASPGAASRRLNGGNLR